MACLEMYNNSTSPSQPPPMSPRISFSNDFVESQNSHHLLNTSRSLERPPPSSDFEFSVSNYSMLPADELFFKGRLLPFKDNNNGNNGQAQRTLRDELLVDDESGFSLKPPKPSSSNRWKGFLGLRKSHIGSKKSEKSSSFDDGKRFAFPPGNANLTLSPQDTVSNDGSSSTDMEMGV
ncbi:hypothetical protein KSS87_011142 [Heliosperma pusillum]|nr:hypothetical protein KSS87_011142 [Heliosperma pusillum]